MPPARPVLLVSLISVPVAAPGHAHATGGAQNTPPAMATADLQADMIRVSKADRQLRLMRDDRVLRSYRISLGADAQGHKRYESDERTPEGAHLMDARNPRSVAHLPLHISCPDAADRADAKPATSAPAGPL